MSKAGESAASPGTVRGQARRYLEARYGGAVWFKAPETIDNVLERWIWAVASDCEDTVGEECIAAIEAKLQEARAAGQIP